MIKTQDIQLTPQIYFKLWFKKSMLKLSLLFDGLFIAGNLAYILFYSWESYQHHLWTVLMSTFLYAALIIILRILNVRHFYHSPKNKNFYRSFYAEIDEEFIKNTVENGSYGTIKWEDICKVKLIDQYYALQVSKVSVMYFPLGAFSKDDRIKFEQILQQRKLIS